MALIKHFAGQIDTAAGQLAGSGGTQTHANNVITSFEVVEMAYNELNDKLTVKSEFEALKLIYNQMLNLNKLHKAVEKLRAAAQAASPTALQQAADTLKDNVTNLRDKTDNEAHVNAKNVKDKFNEVKNAFNKLGTAQTTVKQDWEDLKAVYDNIGFCYKDVKFYSIIVPCIFSMSSDLSPSTKYVWHGNKRTNNGFHGWTEYKDHQGKANDESGEAAECPDPSGQPQTYKHVPNHIATGPFNGTITYTTTKDINKIIITGIPTNKVTEGEPIKIAGTVKITTGTVEYINGKARVTKGTPPTATAQIATATQATITPIKDGKATLEIDITITPDTAEHKAALDALAHLAIPVGPCKVKVDRDKITIKITYDQNDKYSPGKYTDIEITNIAEALKTLGLTTTDNATVEVAPPPNHLTIKYKDGSVEKTAAVAKPKEAKNAQAQGMTAITEEIAQKIKKDLKQTVSDQDSNAKTYYTVTDPKTNIRYYFKITTQLTTGKPITVPVIVQYVYGHIFAEGFGNLEDIKESMFSPLLIVLVGMGLAYDYFRDTQKEIITYHNATKGTDNPPKVESKDLDPDDINPKNLTTEDISNLTINNITVTDKDGKKTTYTNVGKGTAATPGNHTLTIKVGKADGETTEVTFTKQGTAGPGTPGTITITLKTASKDKCIKITLDTDTKNAASGTDVPYGHIFAETFDTSPVRPEIISPTLMVIVGMVLLIATIFPPVIIAFLRLKGKVWSPQHNRGPGGWGK